MKEHVQTSGQVVVHRKSIPLLIDGAFTNYFSCYEIEELLHIEFGIHGVGHNV